MRRRFPAQGGVAGRERRGHGLWRRTAAAGSNPQCVRGAAALAAERAALSRRRRRCKAQPIQSGNMRWVPGPPGIERPEAPRPRATRRQRAKPDERPLRRPAGRCRSMRRAWRSPTIFPTTPCCRPAAPRRPIRAAQPAYNAPVYQPPPQRALPALGPMRGPNTTAAIMPAAVTPPATLACPLVSALDRWVSEGVQPAALHWFGTPGHRDQADRLLFVPRDGRRGHLEHVRARLRRCARHRRLHARRRAQDHGQGRLARHAGRAGLPARRAALRLRDFHHGAGARLQRLSLRPHPRGPDAARERPPSLPAGRDPGRSGGGQGARGLCQQAWRAGLYRLGADQGGERRCRSRCPARTVMSRTTTTMRDRLDRAPRAG